MDDRKQMTEVRLGIKSYKDLKVHLLAYKLALQVFEVSQEFPNSELYSLTDQIRRSSRSVAVNIREGFAKRKYPNIFIRHLIDAIGSSEETREWLNFALNFGYLPKKTYEDIDKKYDEVNAMLYALINRWVSY